MSQQGGTSRTEAEQPQPRFGGLTSIIPYALMLTNDLNNLTFLFGRRNEKAHDGWPFNLARLVVIPGMFEYNCLR